MFYIHYYITWYELHWSQEPFFSKNPCKCLKTAILPLKPTIFQEIAILSGFWKKVKKVDPPKLAILGGFYFHHFFPKTPVSASNVHYYLYNPQSFKEIAILRHLRVVLEKSEESRPPLKLGVYFLLYIPKTTLRASKWQLN